MHLHRGRLTARAPRNCSCPGHWPGQFSRQSTRQEPVGTRVEPAVASTSRHLLARERVAGVVAARVGRERDTDHLARGVDQRATGVARFQLGREHQHAPVASSKCGRCRFRPRRCSARCARGSRPTARRPGARRPRRPCPPPARPSATAARCRSGTDSTARSASGSNATISACRVRAVVREHMRAALSRDDVRVGDDRARAPRPNHSPPGCGRTRHPAPRPSTVARERRPPRDNVDAGGGPGSDGVANGESADGYGASDTARPSAAKRSGGSGAMSWIHCTTVELRAARRPAARDDERRNEHPDQHQHADAAEDAPADRSHAARGRATRGTSRETVSPRPWPARAVSTRNSAAIVTRPSG